MRNRALALVVVSLALLAGARRTESAPGRAGSKASSDPAASFVYTPPPGFFIQRPSPRGPNPNLALERCQRTAWSHFGCQETFPKEGREFLEKECEARSKPPAIDAIICGRLAEYRVEGVGGRKDVAAGMRTLTQLCEKDDDRPSCATVARYLAPEKPAKARTFFYRACSDSQKAPLGLCIQVNELLNGKKPASP